MTSKRHIPDMPPQVTKNAVHYWELFTGTYNFEDAEAPRLAVLCNLYALADKCQSMSFSKKDGEPLVLMPRKIISGDPDDTQKVPNPFIEELGGIQREIERVSAALGIVVSEKMPVKPSVESPVDRAARKVSERDS